MFDAILGHDRIKKQLEFHLVQKKFHQAYLFSGPGNIGKMTFATVFMRQINPDIRKPLVMGRSQGLLAFLDDQESLKVEAIRTIADFAKFRIPEGDHAFCLIEHAERMTIAAANAFLKILEEPIPGLMFVMTTRQEKKLLPTIRSRIQIFRMTIPPLKTVEHALQEKISNPVTIQELLTLSGGRIGLVMSFLQNPERLDHMRKLYDDAAIVLHQDLPDRFSMAETMSEKDYADEDILQFLLFLADRLRRDGVKQHLSSLTRLQELSRLFKETNVNKRLFLEEFMLNLEIKK